MTNVWHSTIEGGYWTPHFSRLLNDWEVKLSFEFAREECVLGRER